MTVKAILLTIAVIAPCYTLTGTKLGSSQAVYGVAQVAESQPQLCETCLGFTLKGYQRSPLLHLDLLTRKHSFSKP